MSNTRIDNNNSELLSILDTVNNLPEAGEGLDTSDATATASDILNGKTAYVDGEKITGNIAFQAAKTITPSTVNQIAISAGYYASGSVTVKGDSNLVAGNIKSGTSIFGIIGTYEGGGGSDDSEANDIIDGMITRTITEVSNNRVTSIANYAFAYCSKLTSVNFPECTSIANYAFAYCSKLTSVNFPECTSIGNYAFSYCSSLTSVNFPKCTSIDYYAFGRCSKLTSVNFPKCTSISSYAFDHCSSLTSVNFPKCTSIANYAFGRCSKLTSVNFPECTRIGNYAFAYCSSLTNLTLGASSVATLNNVNAFVSTPISVSTHTGVFGSIYVPASLVSAYKSATNWATYSRRITAIVE